MKFALKYKDLTVEDWLKVIWSDESKVEIGKNPQADWVLRTAEEKYHVDCLTPVFKSGHSSIMVWGCFTGNRLGPLLAFEKGGISSREYSQTLKDGLLVFLQELNGPEEPLDNDTIQVVTPGQYIFQQDNAPIHVSKATKSLFNDYKLEAMDWPANSPDLNPIKNLWV